MTNQPETSANLPYLSGKFLGSFSITTEEIIDSHRAGHRWPATRQGWERSEGGGNADRSVIELPFA